MDLIYVLGGATAGRDFLELRMSLRSVEKHLKGYGNIYLAGEIPNWVDDMGITYYLDQWSIFNKEANIISKCFRAINIFGVSEYFIFMNDDIFFCKDVHVGNLKTYWKEDLPKAPQSGGPYALAKVRTREWLKDHKYPHTKNFDGHCPNVMCRSALKRSLGLVNWRIEHYIFKSLYYNINREEGEFLPDYKYRSGTDLDTFIKNVGNEYSFSTDDRSMENFQPMRKYLKSLFPDSCSYERSS